MSKELRVLGLSRELFFATKIVCDYSENFKYTLNPQVLRSAISVGSNIAEGSNRSSQKEFIRFLNISLGSLAELRFQLTLYDKPNNPDINKALEIIDNLRPQLISLKRNLK